MSVKDRDKGPESTSVQVALRIRPLTSSDRNQPRFSTQNEHDILSQSSVPPYNSLTVVPYGQQYTFDAVLGTSVGQEEVFERCAKGMVDKFVEGYNVTILAYGQTSSGKTYTMGTAQGVKGSNPQDAGIIPRAMHQLFAALQASQPTSPANSRPHTRSSTPSGIRAPGSTLPRANGIASPPTPRPRKASSNNLIVNGNHDGPADTHAPKYTVKVSFLELYNEELVDLLADNRSPERLPVTIREDTKGVIYWSGVREVPVEDVTDVLHYLAVGSENRVTGATDMNEKSSRSHAIFSVTLRQEKWVSNGTHVRHQTSPVPSASSRTSGTTKRPSSSLAVRAPDTDSSDVEVSGERVVLTSKFHFVDLAGSERLKRTAASGERLKEGIAINAGLSALGNVISALGDPHRKSTTHVPYRDSKLTRLLQDSLGGNAQTLMIACVSPAEYNLVETVNTIKYASRARNIKNKVEKNEEWESENNIEVLKRIIAKLRQEVKELKVGHANGTTDGDGHENSMREKYVGLEKESNDAQRIEIEELQHRLEQVEQEHAMTRSQYQKSERELNRLKQASHNDQTAGASSENSVFSFQELVEPVIEEYEKTIADLDSKLALTRAALNHSDSALQEQEALIQHKSRLHENDLATISELQAQLQRCAERELSSDHYIEQLEVKLAAYTQENARDQSLLTDLRDRIAKFKEMDESTEKYIKELEQRVQESDEELGRVQQTVKDSEKALRETEAKLAELTKSRRVVLGNKHELDDQAPIPRAQPVSSATESIPATATVQVPRSTDVEEEVEASTFDDEPPGRSGRNTMELELQSANIQAKLLEELEQKHSSAKEQLEMYIAKSKASEEEIARLQLQLEHTRQHTAKSEQMALAKAQQEKDYENARMELSNLQVKVAGIEHEKEKLSILVQDLRAIIADQESRLSAADALHASELLTLRSSMTRSERELSLLQEQHDKMVQSLDGGQDAMSDLPKELSRKDELIAQLQDNLFALEQAQKEEDESNKRLEAIQQELTQSRAELSEQATSAKSMQAMIKQLKSEKESLESNLSAIVEINNINEGELVIMKKRLELMTNQAKTESASVQANGNAAALAEELRSSKSKLSQTQQSLDALKSLLEQKETEWMQRQSDEKDYASKVSELEGALANAKQEHQATEAELATTLEQLAQADSQNATLTDKLEQERLSAQTTTDVMLNLEKRIEEADAEITRLKQELFAQKQRWAKQTSEIERKEVAISEHQERLAKITAENDKNLASLQEHMQKLASTDDLHHQQFATISTLRADIDRLQSLANSLEEEKNAHHMRMQEETSRVQSELAKWKADYNETETQKADVERQLQNAVKAQEQMQSLLNQLQRQLSDAETADKLKSDRLHECLAQLAQAEDRGKKEADRYQELAQQFGDLQRTLDTMSKESKVAEETIQQLQMNLNVSEKEKARLSAVQQDLQKNELEADHARSSLQKIMDDLQGELRSAKQQSDSQQTEIATSRKSLQALEKHLSQMQKEKEDHEQTISTVQRQLDESRHQLTTQIREREQHEAGNLEKANLISEFKRTISVYEKEIQNLRSKVTTLEEENREFEELSQTLDDEVHRVSLRMEQTQDTDRARIESLESTITTIKRQSLDNTSVITDLMKKLGQYETEMAEKDEALNEARQRIAELSKVHNSTETANGNLQAEPNGPTESNMDKASLLQSLNELRSTIRKQEQMISDQAQQIRKLKGDVTRDPASTTANLYAASRSQSGSLHADRLHPHGLDPLLSRPPPTPPPSNPVPPAPTSPKDIASPVLMSATRDGTPRTMSPLAGQKQLPSAESTNSIESMLAASRSELKQHQQVISKLESQLNRSEQLCRDARNQVTLLERERDLIARQLSESQDTPTNDSKAADTAVTELEAEKAQLNALLETERKERKKAERARAVLENRLEELMSSRKGKFMCF